LKSYLFTLVTAIVVAGCAAPAAPILVANIDRSSSVRITDVRPASERESQVFSLLVTSDAYGTSRIKEDSVQPSPVRLLQHRTFERFGLQGEPPSLTVHHLVIYRNVSGPGKRTAAGAVGGALGAALGSAVTNQPRGTVPSTAERAAFESTGPDEWKRALYSSAENPNNALCFVIYIDSEIRGKRVFTRTLYTASMDDVNSAVPKAVEAAITRHLDQHSN